MLDGFTTENGRKKVCLLPEYTCDTVILPFLKHNYEMHFYRIRKNLSVDIDWFAECLNYYHPDVVLLHTYYGCDQMDSVYELLDEYKRSSRIIIIEDITQSLFLYDAAVTRADFVVCSLRKWFAIPDGGFSLSTKKCILEKIEEGKDNNSPNANYVQIKRSAQRLKLLYLQGELVEKRQFLNLNGKAEQMLYDREDLCVMSEYTKTYLQRVSIDKKREQRRRNAGFLWRGLNELNIKMAIDLREDTVPLYMPVYINDREKVQKKLRENDIYAPILWPIPKLVAGSLSGDAQYIYEHLLALPCDHRYDERDMWRIINSLRNI